MESRSVLVLSDDALAAALLGALLELEGCRVAFTEPGESVRDALRRLRPGVVVIDAGDARACSAAVIGPAKMVGARVVLFGCRRAADHLRDCALAHDAQPLLMPPEPDELRAALGGAAREAGAW